MHAIGSDHCGMRVLHTVHLRPMLMLIQEYETRETPESRLVKDLDRLELALQAVEYERCACLPPG